MLKIKCQSNKKCPVECARGSSIPGGGTAARDGGQQLAAVGDCDGVTLGDVKEVELEIRAWSTCLHTCPRTCLHTCPHTCVYTGTGLPGTCLHMFAHMSTHMSTHMSAHMSAHLCANTCLHSCLHTCLHSCLHTCLHACLHACLHRHRSTWARNLPRAHPVGRVVPRAITNMP